MAKCEDILRVQTPDNGKVFGIGQSAGRISEMELNWLACAIDTEGSIQLTWAGHKNGYVQIFPRVNLCNNAPEFIEKAVSITHGGYISKQKNGVAYITWCGFKRVKNLLESILPYLVIERKKEIARLVLAFIDYRSSCNPHIEYGPKEKEMFIRVRELNGKGRVSKQQLKFRFEKTSETFNHAPETGEDKVRSALKDAANTNATTSSTGGHRL